MTELRSLLNKYHIYVYFLTFLFVVIIIIVISSYLIGQRKSTFFTYYISQYELFLAETMLDESLEMLSLAISQSRSAEDYLVVLASLHSLQKLTDSTNSLTETVLIKARKKFPKNQDFTALMVNYLLAQGQVYQAANLAQKITKSAYLSLKQESLLRSSRSLSSAALDQLDLPLPLRAEEMSNPERMIEAGLITMDVRYFINAALMYAALGKMRDAFTILYGRRDLFDQDSSALILLMLAHNLRDYESLDTILQLFSDDSLPELGLLLADMYFHQGKSDRSYAIHQDLADQGLSPLSYQNQLSLIRAHGYNADPPIHSALEKHPMNTAILLHFLALDAERSSQSFSNSFNYYHTLWPDRELGWIAELYYYINTEENYRLEDGVLALWEILNSELSENSMSKKSTRDLLLFFFSLNDDRTEMAKLLQRYEELYDPTLLLFSGISAFAMNSRAEATRYFRFASEKENFQASFNLGLISLEGGNLPDAQKWFKLAANQADYLTGKNIENAEGLYNPELMKIYLYRAIVEALLGNRTGAQEILNLLKEQDYYHIFLPKLKGLVAESGIN